MRYLTEAEVRKKAETTTLLSHKSARKLLVEATANINETFDVFLSHSSDEPEDILLGVKKTLEDDGLKIYVDKYSDSQLSPTDVTPETAELLRKRMHQSNALLYVYSAHSTKSRWMPWELGFFDGLKGNVGIIPVTRNQEETFKGEEYLNIYPPVFSALGSKSNVLRLWIGTSVHSCARLSNWVRGTAKIRKRD